MHCAKWPYRHMLRSVADGICTAVLGIQGQFLGAFVVGMREGMQLVLQVGYVPVLQAGYVVG